MADAVKAQFIADSLADLEKAQPFVEGRVAPHKVFDAEGLRTRALAMTAGEGLPEHTAAFPLLVIGLSGSCEFEIEGETRVLEAGGMVYAAAHVPHAVKAITDARVLLVLLTK